jgi:predicted regulator of Ras-like GTPase activity (Roadblock/LC7/MglB family)
MTVRDDAQRFVGLLDDFVTGAAGVSDAVAVSPDGLLMARSESLDDAGADQVAAIMLGLASLGHGAVRCLAFDELHQVIVAMAGGYLVVSALAGGGCLGVVAAAAGDIGDVGYRTALLVERCDEMLDPDLVAELKAQVLGR